MTSTLRPFLILLSLAFVGLALPAHAQKLPDTITQISADAVGTDGDQITKVLLSDILQDKDAKRFITNWNSLKVHPGDNHCVCHSVYRLGFYEAKAKINRYVAICFECHAIYILNSENPDHLEDEFLFVDSPASNDLHRMLSRMFPDFERRK